MLRCLVLILACFSLSLLVSATATAQGIFPDSALDSIVRQEVFSKRNNLEPLTIEDVAKISRVVGKGAKVESLEGLQHCRALMEIDLENNQIVDLAPLRDLKLLQKVMLAGNKIELLDPISGLEAIQYLDVSRNRIARLDAVRAMRNLRSIYFEENLVDSLTPLEGCKRLWSLYGSKNPIKDFSVLASLPSVDTIHLNETGFQDLRVLTRLKQLKSLQLRGNQINDLEPLVQICKEDYEGKKRFAPYLKVNIQANPLSEAGHAEQIAKIRETGVRLSVDND